MKRFVSFTVARVYKIPPSEQSSCSEVFSTKKGDKKGKRKSLEKKEPKKSALKNVEHTTVPVYDTCPLIPSVQIKQSDTYAQMLAKDPKMKSLYDTEIREREELLELHLDTPGLFREMLFTNQEEETMEKLKILVKDITRYSETTRKTMLSFVNDKNVARITKDKIEACFKELRKEVSISEKQAAEYTERPTTHVCQTLICTDPYCPKW